MKSLNIHLFAAGFGRIDDRFTDEDPDLTSRLRSTSQQRPTCQPVTTTTTTTTTTTPPTTSGGTGNADGRYVHPRYAQAARDGACSPHYSTVCIPTKAYAKAHGLGASSGDIDCPKAGVSGNSRLPTDEHFWKFPTTVNGDEHGLDSPDDADKVACETHW